MKIYSDKRFALSARKMIAMVLAVALVTMLAACGKEDHTGEAKTPSGSIIMKGRNYEEVVEEFKEHGFRNIQTEKIEDLIFGWLTEDGEVEEVSVGGDVDYSPDEWVPDDTEVIIKYHTFPEDVEETTEAQETEAETEPAATQEQDSEPEESASAPMPTESEAPATEPELSVLTVDNCPELKEMLSNKAEIDDSYINFALRYAGRTISFDGRIDYCVNHGDYKTRFDYLVSAGDYDPDHQIGPTFKFENVAYYDLHTTLESVPVGINVRITAKVGKFNRNTGLFYLEPVSITGR